MGLFADPWLRDAREKIKSLPEEPSVANEWSSAVSDKLADAVEKAIKAALVENRGSIPQKYNHAKLVSLCQATGVWDVLPPALKHLVQEVEYYRIANDGLAQPSSGRDKLREYFAVARRLIDYMEYHVIGNDSVLRRLKVN